MNGSIIGIDPGTLCGWAVLHVDGSMDSGTWDLKPRRFEGGGMRYVRLRAHLEELIDLTQPEAVFFEEVRRHAGTDAAHIFGGIVAVITELCETRGIPYSAIPVGTVKKAATGKGNANKAAMIAASHQRWPDAEINDDNEADARWIAICGAGALDMTGSSNEETSKSINM